MLHKNICCKFISASSQTAGQGKISVPTEVMILVSYQATPSPIYWSGDQYFSTYYSASIIPCAAKLNINSSIWILGITVSHCFADQNTSVTTPRAAVCMHSPCQCGFSPSTPASSHLKTHAIRFVAKHGKNFSVCLHMWACNRLATDSGCCLPLARSRLGKAPPTPTCILTLPSIKLKYQEVHRPWCLCKVVTSVYL